MSQVTLTQSKNYELIKEQVKIKTPDHIINIAATAQDLIDESMDRIKREGSVVRDMKGSVIEHPSIAIQIKQSKLLQDTLAKWVK